MSAAILTMLIHYDIFVISNTSYTSLSSLCFVIVCPSCSFLMSSSYRVHALNFVLCIIQHFYIVFNIRESFQVTFTEEQAVQVSQFQFTSLVSIVLLELIFFLQKTIEANICLAAEAQYRQIENVNREVVQIIQAKNKQSDSISSFCNGIADSLKHIKKALGTLILIVRERSHINILDDITLKAEMVLNLLNRVSDLQKLKSRSLVLEYKTTNLLEITKRAIMAHLSTFEHKSISAEVFFDKFLPVNINTDSFRLLNLLIDSIHNTIKHTKSQGKVRIYLLWDSSDTPKRNLEEAWNDDFYDDVSGSSKTNESYVLLEDSFLYGPDSGSEIAGRPVSVKEFSSKEAKSRINNFKCLQTFENKSFKGLSIKEAAIEKKFLVLSLDEVAKTDAKLIEKALSSLGTQNTRNTNKKGYLKVQILSAGLDPTTSSSLRTLTENLSGDLNEDYFEQRDQADIWIYQQLCKKMQGGSKIRLEANKGLASIFYTLVNIVSPQEALIRGPSTDNLPPADIRALVVDDYEYNRDIHRLLLEKEGVQVDLASDGKEALKVYTTKRSGYYNFVMMDIQMPNMNGIEAFRKIREWEEARKWKKVTVCFVSGDYCSLEQIMTELNKIGRISERTGIKCMPKPIDIERIRQLIKQSSDGRYKET